MLINALNYSLHAANSAYKFKPVINYNQVRYSLSPIQVYEGSLTRETGYDVSQIVSKHMQHLYF